ncbi:hypothetical protein Tco_0568496 [Tanacetum coccineum]
MLALLHTALNHPSSSHPLDDPINENDDESSHFNPSSSSQNVSSSSNDVSRVRQNPPHENAEITGLKKGKNWKFSFFQKTAPINTQRPPIYLGPPDDMGPPSGGNEIFKSVSLTLLPTTSSWHFPV